MYQSEEIPIEEEIPHNAHTVGNYPDDKLQQINVAYEDFTGQHILYNARPDCKHQVQAQLSGGIRCIKCGGWYCY